MTDRYQDPADEFLSQYVNKRMDGLPSSSTEELLERFQARLMNERRRGKKAIPFLTSKLAWAAVILITIMGCASLIFPQEISAISKKIRSIRIVLQGDSGTVFFNQSDKNSDLDPSNISTEELKAQLTFAPLGPQYVPHGYVFRGHSLNKVGHNDVQISSHYEKDGHFLTIRQFTFSEGQRGPAFDADDTVVEAIEIRGVPGTLLYREKDGWSKVVWVEGDFFFEVAGRLQPKEIVKVADSMRPL
ncbi:DUF4367 domain-containing protein [Desulforudis sp. 1088]|uniref:DUF4367 domain-containing protein n=1 Tax=unclassified Candidatus Desulforudis TaxID=2635950 RepID=UPI003CE4C9D1